MPVKIFQDDERNYQKWLRDNPDGYVLTTTRVISKNYMSLHRASCRMISQYMKNMADDAFTGRGYIKICSPSTIELFNWITKQGGKGFTKHCTICAPKSPKMPVNIDHQIQIQREDVERLFTVGDIVTSGGGRKSFSITEILADRIRIKPTEAKTVSRLYFNRIAAVINNMESIDTNRIEKSVYDLLITQGLKDTQNESYLYGFAKEFLSRVSGRLPSEEDGNPKNDAIKRMASTAQSTTDNANGQQVSRTMKNKEFGFTSKEELERYLEELINDQNGLCAITGLTLQYDAEGIDNELLCSLDLIDSDGHYEPGNLQVVCRFINRWKNDSNNEEFRRLIALVSSVTP